MAKDAVPLRFVSLIIDSIVIFVIQFAFMLVVIFTPLGFLSGIVWAAFAFLYFALMEGTRGQTLGKMAMGLKVVKEDMTPIGLEEGLIRAVDLFLWGLTFGIVALVDLIFVLDNGQRLGDRWAHTVVIKVQ